MMKKYKRQLILSSVMILFPVVIGLLLWEQLPEQMAIHWGIDGKADGWSTKGIAIVSIPVILLVMHWFCMFITIKDPKNKEQSDKVFGIVLWIMPILSLLNCGSLYREAMGMERNGNLLITLPTGILFLLIGNYLPKCRQNMTIGIKLFWTLRSEENWNKTHRFAGRLWVAGGILFLLMSMVPTEKIMWIYGSLLGILVIFPCFYSYGYYHKQLRQGEIRREDLAFSKEEKRWRKWSIAAVAVVLSVSILLLFTGSFTIRFEEDALIIEALYWENLSIPYEAIDAIEYRAEGDKENTGIRTFGYGSITLLMGSFQNQEFGRYTRYSYAACDACIVLDLGDGILVINGKDELETKTLYNQLQKHWQNIHNAKVLNSDEKERFP